MRSGGNFRSLLRDFYVQAALTLFLLSAIGRSGPLFGGSEISATASGLLTNAFLLLTCVTLFIQYRSARDEQARFWRLVLVSFTFWLMARLLWLVVGQEAWTPSLNIVTDLAYLSSYTALLLSLATRPYLADWKSHRELFSLEAAARVGTIVGIILYWIAVPQWLSSATESNERLLSYYLYLLMDGVLLVALLYTFAFCRSVRWRWVYGALAFSFITSVFLDLIPVLRSASILSGQSSAYWMNVVSMLFPIQFLVLVAVIRRHDSWTDETPGVSLSPQSLASGRSSPMLYALVLPGFHLISSRIGLFPDHLRPVQEWIVLAFLAVLGVLASIYQRRSDRLRRRAQSELEASEERFHDMARLLPGIVFEIDETGRILFLNRQAQEITGYSPEELLSGAQAWQLIEPEDLELVRASFTDMLEGGAGTAEEFRIVCRDGRRLPVLAESQAVIRDGKVVGLRGFLMDISARKNLEEQLMHSQKMEVIGRLAGGVAHDFNNLLTVIRGHAELARTSISEKSPAHHDLVEIELATDRATVLTRQLLTFSRKQVQRPIPVVLSDVVLGAERMVERLIGEDIVIDLSLSQDRSKILADPGQLELALVNLVVNARDAMPGGGKLSIATSVAVFEAGDSVPDGLPPGRYAFLSVADTGTGMDRGTAARIFEPFFTTKDPGKGTGLGLSTVQSIVSQAGGTIRLESEPGQGTRFRLYFPTL